MGVVLLRQEHVFLHQQLTQLLERNRQQELYLLWELDKHGEKVNLLERYQDALILGSNLLDCADVATEDSLDNDSVNVVHHVYGQGLLIFMLSAR